MGADRKQDNIATKDRMNNTGDAKPTLYQQQLANVNSRLLCTRWRYSLP